MKPLEPLATRFVPPRLPGLPGLPGAPRGFRVSHHFERGVFRNCKAPSGVWRVLEGVSGVSGVYRGLEGFGRVFRSSRVLEGYPRFSSVSDCSRGVCRVLAGGFPELFQGPPGASRGWAWKLPKDPWRHLPRRLQTPPLEKASPLRRPAQAPSRPSSRFQGRSWTAS